MESLIKKILDDHDAVSISYLQRKYKLNYNFAKDYLENIKINNTSKIYSKNTLVRLIKT